MIEILHGDCFELIKDVESKSIDLILEDMPYNITACNWDCKIDLEKYWESRKRIIKDNGAIVLFGSEPFSSYLRMSNIKDFKYDWIWNKKLAGNGILAKRQPLKIHETISVFNSTIYKPQMIKGIFRKKMGLRESEITGGDSFCDTTQNDLYYPVSIQEFSIAGLRRYRFHPTEKPVSLFEYLIKTYTNENNLVFDGFLGSGTTAVACKQLNRNYIGIEKEQKYFEISIDRVDKVRVINREYF